MSYVSKLILCLSLCLGTFCGANASVLEIKGENFVDAISSGNVVVDFYADWCGPCKKLAPVFAKLSDEMEDSVIFVKLNVDYAGDSLNSYKIKSIPTVILFKDGKEVARNVGYMDMKTMRNFIQNNI
jgi:thioredoxin 1